MGFKADPSETLVNLTGPTAEHRKPSSSPRKPIGALSIRTGFGGGSYSAIMEGHRGTTGE